MIKTLLTEIQSD